MQFLESNDLLTDMDLFHSEVRSYRKCSSGHKIDLKYISLDCTTNKL